MEEDKTRKASKIIAYVLIVLLLVGIVGVIFAFTNGFTEDFKTFYLVNGDEQIMSSESKRTFKQGESYRFDVKYTFNTEQTGTKDYTVKIVANVKTPFNYTVGDKAYSYQDGTNLTSAFDLKKEQTYFALKIDNDMSMQKVLEKLYSGKTVSAEIPSSAQSGYPYALVVTSYNEKATIKINFKFNARVTGVEFENEELLF